MRKLTLKFAFIAIFSIQLVCSYGQSTSTSHIEVITKKQPKPINGRPLAPSKQIISFVYHTATSLCTFTLTEELGLVSVSFVNKNDTCTFYVEVSSDEPETYVNLTCGSYDVICTTEDNISYYGSFELY
jgi:hypothetical protein